MQPKEKNKEKELEFLYPGDIWQALFGESYQDKIEDFISFGIKNGVVQATKIMFHDVYTFLHHKPETSKIGFISLIQHLEKKKENIFTVGFPFFEGAENEFDLKNIRGNSRHYKFEGYNLLDFGNGASYMWMYNPLYGQHLSLLERTLQKSQKVKFCVAGLGVQVEQTPETKIKVDKGGMYEVALNDFIENNPDKTKEDFPYVEIDASHASGLFQTHDCVDAYEFLANISKVEEFNFYNTDFYCLEVEPLRDPEGENLRVNLYVNKNELNGYVPSVGDNIHGLMQLTAYIPQEEVKRLEDSFKTKIEIITKTDRIEYDAEVPYNDDDFATGLAFRETLAEKNGMFYKYGTSEYVSMWTPQTLIPVDMIFVDNCGNIIKIARNAKPLSREMHYCNNVAAVFEINGGECDKYGIKEGDILLHKSLNPNYEYGKLNINNGEEYYRYQNDLYAVKDGSLYFYSFKSHRWYLYDNSAPVIDNRMKSYEIQGFEKIRLTEEETQRLIIQYENDLRNDYAKTLKRFYRLRGCLFYSHDEINNKYQLYLYEKGWIDIDWLSDAYHFINPFRDLAIKTTSTEIDKLVAEYKKRSVEHNKKEDEINLTHMGYYEKESSKEEFYLVLGGTLWRINEESKKYETYSQVSDSWESMRWLRDKLQHEVECAKHLGQPLSYEEAIKTKKLLREEYLERRKN